MAALARLSSRLLFKRSPAALSAVRSDSSASGGKSTEDKYDAIDKEPSSAAAHFNDPKQLGFFSRMFRRLTTDPNEKLILENIKETIKNAPPEEREKLFLDHLQSVQNMSRVERMKEVGYTLGDHRYEELERIRGVSDPFDMGVQLVKERGSVEKPILVPSVTGYRLVGCICEEDECDIEWMTIFKGEMRRCNCGHWFQLIDVNELNPANQPQKQAVSQ